MIDPARRLLFVHIARTGGTSIETALIGRDWWEIDPATKHVSASQARALYGEAVWREYTTFSVVRNPWDRVVSMRATGWWSDHRTHLGGRDPGTLREFVLGLRPHPASERYPSLPCADILDEEVDFVLRFERLQADFAAMLAAVGLSDVPLPHAERRERGPYRAYYDADTAALVGQVFGRDVERYGYTF
jgi:hypothetical protein